MTPARPVPGWFWIAALAIIIFEALGCYAYLIDVTRSPDAIAALPIDQQRMWQATPWWIYAAYGLAVWVGLAGAIALMLRSRRAVPLLGVSLLAVIVQFGGVFLVPAIRQVTPPEAVIVPIVIVIASAIIFALALHARSKGWLGRSRSAA